MAENPNQLTDEQYLALSPDERQHLVTVWANRVKKGLPAIPPAPTGQRDLGEDDPSRVSSVPGFFREAIRNTAWNVPFSGLIGEGLESVGEVIGKPGLAQIMPRPPARALSPNPNAGGMVAGTAADMVLGAAQGIGEIVGGGAIGTALGGPVGGVAGLASAGGLGELGRMRQEEQIKLERAKQQYAQEQDYVLPDNMGRTNAPGNMMADVLPRVATVPGAARVALSAAAPVAGSWLAGKASGSLIEGALAKGLERPAAGAIAGHLAGLGAADAVTGALQAGATMAEQTKHMTGETPDIWETIEMLKSPQGLVNIASGVAMGAGGNISGLRGAPAHFNTIKNTVRGKARDAGQRGAEIPSADYGPMTGGKFAKQVLEGEARAGYAEGQKLRADSEAEAKAQADRQAKIEGFEKQAPNLAGGMWDAVEQMDEANPMAAQYWDAIRGNKDPAAVVDALLAGEKIDPDALPILKQRMLEEFEQRRPIWSDLLSEQKAAGIEKYFRDKPTNLTQFERDMLVSRLGPLRQANEATTAMDQYYAERAKQKAAGIASDVLGKQRAEDVLRTNRKASLGRWDQAMADIEAAADRRIRQRADNPIETDGLGPEAQKIADAEARKAAKQAAKARAEEARSAAAEEANLQNAAAHSGEPNQGGDSHEKYSLAIDPELGSTMATGEAFAGTDAPTPIASLLDKYGFSGKPMVTEPAADVGNVPVGGGRFVTEGEGAESKAQPQPRIWNPATKTVVTPGQPRTSPHVPISDPTRPAKSGLTGGKPEVSGVRTEDVFQHLTKQEGIGVELAKGLKKAYGSVSLDKIGDIIGIKLSKWNTGLRRTAAARTLAHESAHKGKVLAAMNDMATARKAQPDAADTFAAEDIAIAKEMLPFAATEAEIKAIKAKNVNKGALLKYAKYRLSESELAADRYGLYILDPARFQEIAPRTFADLEAAINRSPELLRYTNQIREFGSRPIADTADEMLNIREQGRQTVLATEAERDKLKQREAVPWFTRMFDKGKTELFSPAAVTERKERAKVKAMQARGEAVDPNVPRMESISDVAAQKGLNEQFNRDAVNALDRFTASLGYDPTRQSRESIVKDIERDGTWKAANALAGVYNDYLNKNRTNIAKPMLAGARTHEAEIEAIRLAVGPEKFAKIDRFVKDMSQLYKDRVLTPMYEAGGYSEKVYKMFMDNPYYLPTGAAFYGASGGKMMQRTTGSLKDPSPPLIKAILQGQRILGTVEKWRVAKLVRENADFFWANEDGGWKVWEGADIGKAKATKGGYKIIHGMRDGKAWAMEVPEGVAALVDTPEGRALGDFTGFLHDWQQKIFRPMQTTLSTVFQPRNLYRDVTETATMLPDMPDANPLAVAAGRLTGLSLLGKWAEIAGGYGKNFKGAMWALQNSISLKDLKAEGGSIQPGDAVYLRTGPLAKQHVSVESVSPDGKTITIIKPDGGGTISVPERQIAAVRGKVGKVFREMEEHDVLTIGDSFLWGDSTEASADVQRSFGLDPTTATTSADKFLKGVNLVLQKSIVGQIPQSFGRGMTRLGSAGELASKASGFQAYQRRGYSGRELGEMTRNRVSTPHARKWGMGSRALNAVFPYSSIFISGLRGRGNAMFRDKRSRGSAIANIMWAEVLPELAMLAMSRDLIPEDMMPDGYKEWQEKFKTLRGNIGRYLLDNYLAIPLWTETDPTDSQEKTRVLKIPKTIYGKLLTASIHAALDVYDRAKIARDIPVDSEEYRYGAGIAEVLAKFALSIPAMMLDETPGLHPVLRSMTRVGQLSGGQEIKSYTGAPIITQAEAAAKFSPGNLYKLGAAALADTGIKGLNPLQMYNGGLTQLTNQGQFEESRIVRDQDELNQQRMREDVDSAVRKRLNMRANPTGEDPPEVWESFTPTMRQSYRKKVMEATGPGGKPGAYRRGESKRVRGYRRRQEWDQQ